MNFYVLVFILIIIPNYVYGDLSLTEECSIVKQLYKNINNNCCNDVKISCKNNHITELYVFYY